jgi:ABC-2 type transport system permease protein
MSTVFYVVLGVAFVWVGMRESALLGFTGMSRVLFSYVHALVVLLPLLALSASAQTINTARAEGTLEFILSQPIERGAYFTGVVAVRYAALVLPFVVLIGIMGVVSRVVFGTSVDLAFWLISLVVGGALILAFLGLGMLVATFANTPQRALIAMLAVWALAAALMDVGLIGLMLRWRLHPLAVFGLAALNPIEAARVALVASADGDLSALGPVGFFLSNRLGTAGLLALGVGWPAFLGGACSALALHRFKAMDLV